MALSPSRSSPRLSASQLADYLVSPTPVGQIGILRQAKFPGQSKPLIIQYQHARRCISSCLQSPASTQRTIGAAIASLEQRRDDTSSSALIRDDAVRSIDVIERFSRIVNALELGNAVYDAAPRDALPLIIAGVEISVWPDAIARATTRGGETRVGEVFIRCTIGASGEAAENRRAEANGHLATIAHMHAVATLSDAGTPYAPISAVIDVPRETVVRGPVNIARRIANIEAACLMIASVWPSINSN